MNVKKSQSGRRRGPSTFLWQVVNKIDDSSWQRLNAFSDVYGKNSLQFRLLDFLRTLPVYDSKLEKEEFAHCDLYSLRNAAKKWLFRTSKQLGIGSTEIDELYSDAQLAIKWQDFESGLEFNSSAKILANEIEDFVSLSRLLLQEQTLVKLFYSGESRTSEMLRVNNEIQANLLNLEALAQLSDFSSRYMERVRNRLASTGTLDSELTHEYLRTSFHNSDWTSRPISLEIGKYRIDEFFYYAIKDYRMASQVASSACELYRKKDSLRANDKESFPNILARLGTYYVKLEDLPNALRIAEEFEAARATSGEYSQLYLERHIFVLFQIAIDLNQIEFANRVFTLWKEYEEFIESTPLHPQSGMLALYFAMLNLARGNTNEALQMWKVSRKVDLKTTHSAAMHMEFIVHLILLLEDNDELGLESNARNYKRKLKKLLPISEPALAIVSELSKKKIIHSKVVRKKVINRIKTSITLYKEKPEFARSLWYNLLLDWINQIH